MFFNRERRLQVALAIGDAGIAALLMGLAVSLRGSPLGSAWLPPGQDPGVVDALRAALVCAAVTPVALRRFGAYEGYRRQKLSRTIGALARGVALCAALLAVAGAALGLVALTPAVACAWGVLQVGPSAALRLATFGLLQWLGAKGRSLGTFVVVGTGPRARRVAEDLTARRGWGLRNLGFLDDAPRKRDVEILGERYLGQTKEIADLVAREVIDEVIVALPRRHLCSEATAELVALCEAVGIEVTIASDLFMTRRARPQLHHMLSLPGMTLSNYPHRSIGALAVKRTIDVLGALAGIVLTAPLWLAIAIAVRLDSPGPIFFVQRRSSLHGRTFPFLKFRTMVPDAEKRLADLREQNEVSGPVFKMRQDPRVTRVGRFLRKYSLDELPQLLNVLAGHMSLVGPRPPIPGEVNQYDLSERRRLSVRPGLTGLWQVSGRSNIGFEEWVRLDLDYIDHWSLWLDLRILLRTIPAVLKGRGAA
jgi:exopolysaccharide biosynthesis polyprenyl glycosylphosphotransferase